MTSPIAECCTASVARMCVRGQATEVSVPATLQAAIAARIDRLDGVAKRTLNAAAVIGLRFGADLPAVLVVCPAINWL